MRLLEELLADPRSQAREHEDNTTGGHATGFQHPSERRFARLLDFYGVGWRYEPDVFPIEWDDETGQPCGYFRPDFHLPAFDVYIEITTSQQHLVTKKNRKLRLLRAHHPQVRCKLFYQRDYYELVRKFGLDDDLAADEDL